MSKEASRFFSRSKYIHQRAQQKKQDNKAQETKKIASYLFWNPKKYKDISASVRIKLPNTTN